MTRYLISFVLIISLSACTCNRHCTPSQEDFGVLQTAVSFSADKVIGEYGDTIPDDFNSKKFIALVKDKIPESHLNAMEKYILIVTPKKTHYYLEVICPKDKSALLFDYSCTPEVDGPIYLSHGEYDPKNDPCE
jgi:thioredoxin-related protein